MKSDFSLTDARRKIEETDRELLRLFAERMAVCDGIGSYKAEKGLSVFCPDREDALVRSAVEKYPSLSPEIERLYDAVLTASRLRQTAKNGKKYAVIGHPIAHSRSPELHAMLASFPYETLDVLPDEIEKTLKDPAYAGFNVTVPYKEAVIPFLDRLTPEAKDIGAVNTVRREEDGTLTGHVTDPDGFALLLDTVLPVAESGKKNAVILGDGGTAKVARHVLSERGFSTVTVSRRASEKQKKDYPTVGYDRLYEAAKSADLLVNTTPVGMWPNEEASPCDPTLFSRLSAVIDVIYRPEKTELLLRAEERNIPAVGGLPMLVRQGVRSFEFFHRVTVPAFTEARILRKMKESVPVVLVGLPGVGKTSVGRALAEKLGKDFNDTDEVFSDIFGVSPADCIRAEGENAFRQKEEDVVLGVLRNANGIVSLGGGSILSEKVRRAIRRDAVCVFLAADTADLPTDDRPLSQNGGLSALAAERLPIYEKLADLRVPRGPSPEKTAEDVLFALANGPTDKDRPFPLRKE